MRRLGRFRLMETTCKRCGKPLVTGNRSLNGNEDLKKKFERICGSCMTPEEKNELIFGIKPQKVE